jgi:hypothetical protein
MAGAPGNGNGQTTRSLNLVEMAALSIALIGPSLVLAANAQSIPAAVTQPIWLIFLIGMVGIATVGHAFVRLLPLTDGPGSAYLAVQATLGRVPGLLAGVALLGAYLGFSLATPAAIVSFTEAVYAPPVGGYGTGFKLVLMTMVMAAAALIVTRPSSTIMRILLLVEGLGILLILVLGACIAVAPGGVAAPVASAPASGGGMHLLDGVVVAFFSWAGFESCMTLAGSSRNPKRDMPAALGLSVVSSGLLFVVMFALIELGFARMLGGRAALAGSANALVDLGRVYLGAWSITGFGLAALCSAFACLVAAATSAGAIFGSLVGRMQEADSHRLALCVIALVWVIECAMIVLQPHVAGLPTQAIGLYALFGGSGAVCIMLAYLLVLAGSGIAIATGRVQAARAEMLISLAGLAFILFALASTISLAGSAAASTIIAAAFCALGLAGFLLSRRHSQPEGIA